MIRLFILFSILCCFAGCSSLTQQSSEPEKYDQQRSGQKFKLLPPDQGPSSALLKQTVTMEARGEKHQFIAVIRLEKERVKMVGLLPTGQAIFSLEYDGDQLTQESFTSVDIPGEEILTIMQFALWPESSVKQHYPENEGWSVLFSSDQRKLKNSSDTLLEVNYQKDDLIVENYQHDYRILIHTLEKKDL